MAECRDFFHEPTSGGCRSGSLGENPSISALAEGVEEVGSHCLELTLTLGPSVSGVRASSSPPWVSSTSVSTCLPKQSSGNFASSAPSLPASDVDVSQASLSQSDASKGPHSFTAQAQVAVLAKQRSGTFAFTGTHTHPLFAGQTDAGLAVKALLPSGDTRIPSRDQIWLTLKRNGAVSGQDLEHPNESSAIWSRRATSMNVMIPRMDVGDAENPRIRRSCSSGVFPHADLRRVSSVEFSLDKSPQQNNVLTQDHDREALQDLQKRKEMQAKRTQEARKRRKILIEEKQQKKSKHCTSLQRPGGRHSVSPNDKFPPTGTPPSEDGVTPDSSPDVSKREVQGNVRKGMIMTQNLCAEGSNQETHPWCRKDDKIDMLASSNDEVEGSNLKGGMSTEGYNSNFRVLFKDGASNWLSHEQNLGSYSSMMTSECEQSTSGGNTVVGSKVLISATEHSHGRSHNSDAVTVTTLHTGVHINEDGGEKSSEAECVESNSIRNNANLLQCTMQKGDVGAMVSSASSTAAGVLNYPVLAVPYPYTVAAPMPTAIPMQPVFPFPFLVQCPGSSHGDNDLSSTHGSCSIVSGTTTTGTSIPGALVSIASSASKDCVGESFEGKGTGSEKSAFNPLSRTASILKHVKEEPQGLGAKLRSQVTFPASQLSSLSSVVSDASNSKKLSLQRQQSMPLGGRLLSQNSSAQDQSSLCSKQERHILDVQQGTPTLRAGTKSEVKQGEGFRQEEASMQSQLTSEHSCVDVSYVQMGSIERKMSGSFPDLPWVTTTGKGPYGKTISGVLYIVNGRHVRLICSCHGKHMSPLEFVEHSGSTDLSNPERHIVVSPFPSFNHQSTSAPVQTSNLES